MPIIITITNELTTVDGSGHIYNYAEYDRILKNIITNEYEVFYSGQNKGRLDYQIENSIINSEIFKIYYRPKKSMPYTYLGETSTVDIVQYRTLDKGINNTSNQRLQIHLIVNNITNSIVPVNNFIGSGRFKKDVLIHSGLRNINNESIIPHNRNTNIGFYSYNIL